MCGSGLFPVSDDKGSNGAYINTDRAALAFQFRPIILAVKADYSLKPSFGKGQDRLAVLVAAGIETLAAQNASIGVIIQTGVLLDDFRFLEVLFKLFGLQADF